MRTAGCPLACPSEATTGEQPRREGRRVTKPSQRGKLDWMGNAGNAGSHRRRKCESYFLLFSFRPSEEQLVFVRARVHAIILHLQPRSHLTWSSNRPTGHPAGRPAGRFRASRGQRQHHDWKHDIIKDFGGASGLNKRVLFCFFSNDVSAIKLGYDGIILTMQGK